MSACCHTHDGRCIPWHDPPTPLKTLFDYFFFHSHIFFLRQSFSPAMTKVLFLVSARPLGDAHTHTLTRTVITGLLQPAGCCVTSAPPHNNKENGSELEEGDADAAERTQSRLRRRGLDAAGFQREKKRPAGSRKQWGAFYNYQWELWAAV